MKDEESCGGSCGAIAVRHQWKAMNLDEQLRCERDCARLCLDFAATVDAGDYDAFIALFERAGQLTRGAEAIRGFLDARPADRVTRHLCTNVRIDMTGPTSASGTCCTLMYQAQATKDTPLPLQASAALVVDYADDYMLSADGWKFKHRRTSVIFRPRTRHREHRNLQTGA